MKILYASSNNAASKIQLSRFLFEMKDSSHQIKIAAYKDHYPSYVSIDWSLNALLNIYRPDVLSLDNDNLKTYFEQIKSYAPDLIISDLEYFTSYVANILNIQLWQCSSSLVNIAMTRSEKHNLGLFKYFAYALNRDPAHNQRTINLIDNSVYNLIYSHYGDTDNPPELQDGFEWIRPYHQVSKFSAPCEHFIVAALAKDNKKIINILKQYNDSVVFMESWTEKYNNILVKNIENNNEYYCNLGNSTIFICQGQASFLADAFYNKKHSIIYTDYNDTESIIDSQLTKKCSLGHIMNYDMDIKLYENDFEPKYNPNIKYLHEKINELR